MEIDKIKDETMDSTEANHFKKLLSVVEVYYKGYGNRKFDNRQVQLWRTVYQHFTQFADSEKQKKIILSVLAEIVIEEINSIPDKTYKTNIMAIIRGRGYNEVVADYQTFEDVIPYWKNKIFIKINARIEAAREKSKGRIREPV